MESAYGSPLCPPLVSREACIDQSQIESNSEAHHLRFAPREEFRGCASAPQYATWSVPLPEMGRPVRGLAGPNNSRRDCFAHEVMPRPRPGGWAGQQANLKPTLAEAVGAALHTPVGTELDRLCAVACGRFSGADRRRDPASVSRPFSRHLEPG